MLTKKNTSDPAKDNGIATGVVIWKGRIMAFSVAAPLLSFDLIQWVEDTRGNLVSTAAECSRRNMKKAATEYLLEANTLLAWTQDHSRGLGAHPALAIREQVPPLNVSRANIEEYLGELFLRADPAVGSFQFLFYVDLEEPVLYTTQRLAFAARHTGKGIVGKIVSEAEIAERVQKARAEISSKPRKREGN